MVNQEWEKKSAWSEQAWSSTFGDAAISQRLALLRGRSSLRSSPSSRAIVVGLAPGWRTDTRPSGSAGSGWNECRGSAGRVEKRVRSINQPPPWWTSIPRLSTRGGEHSTTTPLAARARYVFLAHDASGGCVCAHVCAVARVWVRVHDDPVVDIRDISAHAMTQLRLPDRSRLPPTWHPPKGSTLCVGIILLFSCQPTFAKGFVSRPSSALSGPNSHRDMGMIPRSVSC